MTKNDYEMREFMLKFFQEVPGTSSVAWNKLLSMSRTYHAVHHMHTDVQSCHRANEVNAGNTWLTVRHDLFQAWVVKVYALAFDSKTNQITADLLRKHYNHVRAMQDNWVNSHPSTIDYAVYVGRSRHEAQQQVDGWMTRAIYAVSAANKELDPYCAKITALRNQAIAHVDLNLDPSKLELSVVDVMCIHDAVVRKYNALGLFYTGTSWSMFDGKRTDEEFRRMVGAERRIMSEWRPRETERRKNPHMNL